MLSKPILSRGSAAATALILILLALPLAGAIMTDASWLWPAATLLLTIAIFLLTGLFRSKPPLIDSRLLLFNALFLLNLAYFISYYLQDEGFNDAFFYHAQPNVLYAGIGEFIDLAVGLVGAYVAINLLTLLAGSAPTWRVGRMPAPRILMSATAALVGVAALAVLPPVLSLASYLHPDAAAGLPSRLTGKTVSPRIFIPNSQRIIEELAEKPHLASQKPGKRPHLIVLYLEGVEQKYFNPTLFPDLLPSLRALRERSVRFPNMVQGKGTGWTIAGMVASQCGYPLIFSFRGGANDFGILPTFMPEAVCFGDLLSQAGYSLTYMGGADHRFAGKGNFYRSHGFDKVYGAQDLARRLADPSHQNPWGLFDESLFDFAYDEFLTLVGDSQPAGLVLLTLDTHPPEGYPSASCEPYDEIDNEILHAVHCTDQLVSAFVKRIRETPYSQDTHIVIASDHLALPNTATDMLEEPGEDRRLTFFVNTPDQTSATYPTAGMHYDMTPTILDLLDIQVEGQLGLGRSLLQQDGYLPALMGAEAVKDAYPDWRLGNHIADLWSFNSMNAKEGLSVDLKRRSAAFGGRVYDLTTKHQKLLLPTLFSFDDERIQLTGLYQANPGERTTDELTAKMVKNQDTIYLAIGPYMTLESIVEEGLTAGSIRYAAAAQESMDDEDLVIFLGKAGGNGIVARPASGSLEISSDEIVRLAR